MEQSGGVPARGTAPCAGCGTVRALVAVTLALLIFVVGALAVALILGVADQTAGDRAGGSANGSSFKATATLMTDDSTDGGTTETTQGGAHVGIGAGAGDDTERDGGKDEHFYFFHLMSWFGFRER